MRCSVFGCMFRSDMETLFHLLPAVKRLETLCGPRTPIFVKSCRVCLQPSLCINYVQLWLKWVLPLMQRWVCVFISHSPGGIASPSSQPKLSLVLRKLSGDMFFFLWSCCCSAGCHDWISVAQYTVITHLWPASKQDVLSPLCCTTQKIKTRWPCFQKLLL